MSKKALTLACTILREHRAGHDLCVGADFAPVVVKALTRFISEQEAANAEVAEWIEPGEIPKDAVNVPRILAEAANLLDGSEAHEILGGGILFKGKDGKFYTVTVEAVVGRASKGFVKDTLAEKGAE